MYTVDFSKPIHIHFIGIGGISMSGLAEILLNEHFTITGSDAKASELTKHLESLGARVYIGQCAENIEEDTDLVVYTAAIHADNPEFARVVELGIPMLTRAELLGQIMRNYETPIAISGTHGKTTTTSMAASVLMEGALDPTISVGGILPSIGGNIRVGQSQNFITEACEYTNSFLSFYPKISVILNIDADHLDFFKDLDDIRNSFRRFAEILPADGHLIINADIPNCEEIYKDLPCNVLTYSVNGDAAFTAANVSYNAMGFGCFECLYNGTSIGKFELSVPGEHNISNALSVIAIAHILNMDKETIQKGLLSFHGTNRRFQYKGEIGGVTVIDDYAHHPTEIQATLTAADNYPHKKLWVVFQPHTYTRTSALLTEFADTLSKAETVILADIYAARETNTIGITSKDLKAEIEKRGGNVHYFPSFSEIEDFLLQNCTSGDLVITMGAGDVVNIGEDLLGLRK